MEILTTDQLNKLSTSELQARLSKVSMALQHDVGLDPKGTLKLDATQTIAFSRQLEYIKKQLYDIPFRELTATQFLPVSTEASSGHDSITWRSFSKIGQAKVISDYSHDFPRVDVFGEEHTIRIKDLGASYGYSIKEIRRAVITGYNLSIRKAEAARRAIDEQIDRIAWFGDKLHNIQGFINYPGITEYALTAGAGGGTRWSSKTPDEINADLVNLLNAVTVPTRGKERPNQIILPRREYNILSNTRMGDNTNVTILNYFKNNNEGVMVDIVDILSENADGTDRADDQQIMFAYRRDPMKLTLEIPQPFEQFEPEKKGMEWVVPCHAEIAGVIVYYTHSIAYATGI